MPHLEEVEGEAPLSASTARRGALEQAKEGLDQASAELEWGARVTDSELESAWRTPEE